MTRLESAILAALVATSLAFGARMAWSHSWYPMECCSGVDCRPVDQREIGESGADYTYKGLRFPKAQSKPSPDHQYHICTPVFMGKPYIRCLYRPSPGV